MWSVLNPINWIKRAIKAELKSLVKEYGEMLRQRTIDAVKSQHTEDEINSFFLNAEADIMSRIDAM